MAPPLGSRVFRFRLHSLRCGGYFPSAHSRDPGESNSVSREVYGFSTPIVKRKYLSRPAHRAKRNNSLGPNQIRISIEKEKISLESHSQLRLQPQCHSPPPTLPLPDTYAVTPCTSTMPHPATYTVTPRHLRCYRIRCAVQG